RRAFEDALPRIQLHATIVFRFVACPHRREDLIAEAVALAWLWWVRLCRRGKNPNLFVRALSIFAVRAARNGRRICGQEKSKDVLSPLAQQRHRLAVGAIPFGSTLHGNPLEEALWDNTRTPPDEQAAFRLDFPAWLATYDERRR